MVPVVYLVSVWLCVGAGLISLIFASMGKAPNEVTLGAQVVLEVALVVNLVGAIVLISSGQSSHGPIVEYFAYLISALIIPAAAVFWALIERTSWSTVALGIAALALAVMLVRMHQIWTGNYA